MTSFPVAGKPHFSKKTVHHKGINTVFNRILLEILPRRQPDYRRNSACVLYKKLLHNNYRNSCISDLTLALCCSRHKIATKCTKIQECPCNLKKCIGHLEPPQRETPSHTHLQYGRRPYAGADPLTNLICPIYTLVIHIVTVTLCDTVLVLQYTKGEHIIFLKLHIAAGTYSLEHKRFYRMISVYVFSLKQFLSSCAASQCLPQSTLVCVSLR